MSVDKSSGSAPGQPAAGVALRTGDRRVLTGKAVAYLSAVVLLTVQALAGQSAAPHATLTAWGVALLAAAGLAVIVVLRRRSRAFVAQRRVRVAKGA